MIMISEEPLMHIAIRDDNIADRKQLERLLKRESDKRKAKTGLLFADSFGDCRILSTNHMQYDLFFLDMTASAPDGLTFALQLVENGVTAPIVLCSSKINYKEKASALSGIPDSILYLDKPIITAELSAILDRAEELGACRVPKIELRSEQKTWYVDEDDILYAVQEGRYVHVFLQNGKKVSVLSEMYNFYNTISAFEHFVFLNDRGLINVVHMDHYTPFAVFMKDGYRLPSNPFVMKYIKSALQNITL